MGFGALNAPRRCRCGGVALTHSKKNHRYESRDTTGDEKQDELMDEKSGSQSGEAERQKESVLHRGATEADERVREEREDDGLDALEEMRERGQRAEAHVGPREDGHEERRGQDEAEAGGEKARPASARMADEERHLRGVRARREVRRAEEVEKLLARHPAASRHDLVLHHRDVGRGPAESRRAEAQEERGEILQVRAVPSRHRPRLWAGGGRRRASRFSNSSAPSLSMESEVSENLKTPLVFHVCALASRFPF